MWCIHGVKSQWDGVGVEGITHWDWEPEQDKGCIQVGLALMGHELPEGLGGELPRLAGRAQFQNLCTEGASMWEGFESVPGEFTGVGQCRQGCRSTDRVWRKHMWECCSGGRPEGSWRVQVGEGVAVVIESDWGGSLGTRVTNTNRVKS